MAERELSDAEAQALGLSTAAPGPAERELSDEEAAALGLSGAPATKEQVGAGETFINRFNNAVPLARPLVNAIAALAIKGVPMPSNVQLTDSAKAELRARGQTPVDPNQDQRGLVDTYRDIRGDEQRRTPIGSEQNPTASMAGSGLGFAASILAPVPKIGVGSKAFQATRAGRLAGGAANGAAYGAAVQAGEGDADLTKGEFGKAGLETLGGAAVGGLLGAGAEAVGMGVGGLLKRARSAAKRGIDKAVTDVTEQQTKAVEKAIRSQQGTYRSAVQSASRDLEVLERAAQQADNPELAAKAKEYLASPEGQAVISQVASNKLSTAPERVSEMAGSLEELQRLTAGKEQAIAAGVEDALAEPLKRQFLPRVATLGHRLLPVALGGIGAAVGGSEGAMIGGGIGAATALLQGRPGIILRNLARSPAVRKAVLEKTLGLLGKEVQSGVRTASESAGRAASRALAPEAARAMETRFPVMADEQDPEVLKALALAAALRSR